MKSQIKLKHFYKTFFRIFILLTLQNILTLSVNLADNIMLGNYSEAALSGATAVNQIQFVFQQLVMALGDGIIIVGGQYFGEKRLPEFKKISTIAARAAITVSVLLFLGASVFPEQMVGLFTKDPDIIREGAAYLGVVKYTYVFFAISIILLATMRTVSKVNIAIYMSIVTLVVNCGLNAVFIYGLFGMPRLGVVGAGIGTLVSRIIECAVLVVYVLKDRIVGMRVSDYFKREPELSRDYLRINFPSLLSATLWGLNTAMQTAILGHMTSTAIAANSVASNLHLLVKSLAFGAASATSVIVARTIGEGDLDGLKKYSKRMQIIFAAIGVVGGAGLYFLRGPILGMYTNIEPETIAMANNFLVIMAISFVGMSYQMPTNFGMIKGGGSTIYPMVLDFVSCWIIVIPLSLIMAFVVNASPIVVVCCLNCDQIFKCVPAFITANFCKWHKKLTRTNPF